MIQNLNMPTYNNSKGIKKIHIVYFSCNKHFKYLLISLKSLLNLKSSYITNIYLYIDKSDFLSEENIKILDKLNNNFKIRKTKNLSIKKKGMHVLSEIDVFVELGKEVDGNDYIAKIDSDVVFINDDIFFKVASLDYVLIGQEDHIYWRTNPLTKTSFTQGGCYFLRASFTSNLLCHDGEIIRNINESANHYAIMEEPSDGSYHEDVSIYFLVKNETDKIKFIPFMWFPGVYIRKEEIGCVHPIGYKGTMKYFFYGNWYFFIIAYYFSKYFLRKMYKISDYLKRKIKWYNTVVRLIKKTGHIE